MFKRVNRKSIYRVVFASILISIGALFVAELLAKSYLFAVEDYGHQLTHARNPLFRRGWVEYTESTSIDTDYLVIIITGSQAWAREVENADDTYPRVLQNHLNETSDKSYTVLNWGVPGINLPEYVILMSRLADFDPDLVLFIVDWQDMTNNFLRPLESYNTDVIRLAYHFNSRKYIAQSFLDAHDANNPLQALRNLTYMGILYDYLFLDVPSHWGDDVIQFNSAYAIEKNREDDLKNWSEESDWYLANVMATYLTSVGETPLITITAPYYLGWYNSATQEDVLSLASRLESLWGNLSHVQIIDGVHWIPSDSFFDSSHFDEAGHRIMAEKLLSIIQANLP